VVDFRGWASQKCLAEISKNSDFLGERGKFRDFLSELLENRFSLA